MSAVTKATVKVAAAFREGNLTRNQEETIVKAATTLRVLEGNESLRRGRDDYAESPILTHVKENCSRPGIIYVAYVPNNNGKTTACYAIMDKPYARRAVAFSPDSNRLVPYFDRMVACLEFDTEDPPTGFMSRLLNELAKGEDHPDLERNLLILDNFMPHGFNQVDSDFLHRLKANIKEKNVTALIFTPNKEAACHLLSQNELGVILPLATNDQIRQLRGASPNIDPNIPLVFDWEREVSMVWNQDELKKAVYSSIAFRRLKKAKQTLIRQRFDTVYNGLSKEEREGANPISIFEHFSESRNNITTPRAGTVPSSGTTAGDDSGCCGTGIHCAIS